MRIYVFVAFSLIFLISCTTKKKADLLIYNVDVIDVIEGKAIENQDVFIQGNKIVQIVPHDDSNIFAEINIDGQNKYLIPGLWDMHVHIHDMSDRFLPLFLAHGITGIRDMGNIELDDFNAWKEYVQNLEFAPRLGPVAGKIVEGNDFWANPIVADSKEDGVKAVDSIIAIGGDFVKTYSTLKPEVLRAIIEKANQRNITFAGHYVWGWDLADLSDMGLKSIEHLEISLSYAKNSEELLEKYSGYVLKEKTSDRWLEFFRDINTAHINRDPEKMSVLFQKLRDNRTWQCTAVLAFLWVDALDFNNYGPTDLGLQYYPDSLAQQYMEKGLGKSLEDRAFAVESLKVSLEIVKALYDHEVPLLAGGHPTPLRALPPGISLYRELMLMQEAGIPSSEVLKTATINPAIFMERTDELGSLEPGKLADMVLLRSNPLEDIANTKKVMAVIKDGTYYDRTYLDSVLESVRFR